MHIENFKIFSDLVESESFSRAAKLNGITQSAVSQQLRAMEKHFSILIVDRSQKQFRLTREGQKLFESAKEILYLYDKLNSELQEMKKGDQRHDPHLHRVQYRPARAAALRESLP